MKCKYPIILVHGAFVKNWLFFRCFGKIDKILKKEGHKVYVAKIDASGSIENNAVQLKEYINKIREKEQAEKVNLICHSKGGLDANYLIDKLDGDKIVASLTALCSPFKGSPVANYILSQPEWILKIEEFFINLFYKIIGDKKPRIRTLGEQLKLANESEMPQYTLNENVYYQSYSSTTNNIKENFIDTVPFLISKHMKSVDTDAFVPEDSAKFGEYKGKITEENLSHNQVIDMTASYKKKKIVFAFYKKLTSDLAERGF